MNKNLQFSRRKILIFASISFMGSCLRVSAKSAVLDIHVVKNPQCSCCDSWITILSDMGFKVSVENRSRELLAKFKIKSGIPRNMMSCHTANIMGYFIEGHVPAKDIKHLIYERPNALGLAVPGMPYSSPGMGPEAEREAYDVFMIRQDGTPEVFQHYPKAGLLI